MLTVKFNTRLFFDRQSVIDKTTAAERKALSRAGAFLRQRARTSLRRRKRTSRPGETPSIHSKDAFVNLKNILFQYEPQEHGVVVGPVGLHSKVDGKTVPEIHEHGARVRIRERRVGKYWMVGGRARPDQPTRVRTAVYAPRPFMGPALAAERPKLASHWAASVR